VTVRTASANNTTVTADCGAGNHALGGGGSTGGGGSNFTQSYPATDAAGTAATNASTNPRFWTTKFATATGSNTSYAICVPN
jgi:hypothetical protein